MNILKLLPLILPLVPLMLPFVMPVLFHAAYQPINRAWTVEEFGCGCPPLDGSWRFNANHFNSLLWLFVAGVALSLWSFQWNRAFVSSPFCQRSLWPWICGSGAILFLCLKMLAKEVWM